MEYANLNIRTTKETKEAAEKIFEALGMTTTTACNIFLKQVVRTNGIPFSVVLDAPKSGENRDTSSKETKAAEDAAFIETAGRILNEHRKAFEELAK